MYVTQYVDNTRYGQSSVAEYAGYLEKESLIQSQLDETSSRQLSAYLDKQNDVVRVEGREYFFNGTGNTYDTEDVVKNIDPRSEEEGSPLLYILDLSFEGRDRPFAPHDRRYEADTPRSRGGDPFDAGGRYDAELSERLCHTVHGCLCP